MNIDKPLSEIFLEEGYLSRAQLNDILAHRDDTTEPLGDLLVRLKVVTEKQKLKCVGLQMGVPFIDISRVEIDDELARMLPHTVAMRLLAVPIEVTEISASVAMVDPLNLGALDELSSILNRDIDPMIATENDVRDAIFRSYGAYDDLGEIVGEAIKGVDTDSIRLQSIEEGPSVTARFSY
jgi:type IV pilus assembly protein PilB